MKTRVYSSGTIMTIYMES